MKQQNSIESTNPVDRLTTLHVFADDYTPLRSWDLVQWCKRHGADELTANSVGLSGTSSASLTHFQQIMMPFQRPQAQRRHLSARRVEELGRPSDLWQFTTGSLFGLQQFFPNGLFSYDVGDQDWFEDPIFYRRGELMLGVVSHEGEGILRVSSEEQRELEKVGFPFHLQSSYVGF